MTLRIGLFSAAPAAATSAVLAVRDRVRALTATRRVPRPA